MTEHVAQLVADARAHLITCGLSACVAARIPTATILFHLAHGESFDDLYAICVGRRQAVQPEAK